MKKLNFIFVFVLAVNLCTAQTPGWIRDLDPTDKNSKTRKNLRAIDPTNPANWTKWFTVHPPISSESVPKTVTNNMIYVVNRTNQAWNYEYSPNGQSWLSQKVEATKAIPHETNGKMIFRMRFTDRNPIQYNLESNKKYSIQRQNNNIDLFRE